MCEVHQAAHLTAAADSTFTYPDRTMEAASDSSSAAGGRPVSGSPPGPTEPFPIDVDAATLDYLMEGCARFGDVWCVPPLVGDARKGMAVTGAGDLPLWVLNEPDAIHRVLTKRQPFYGKGVGFERVKMLLGDGLIVSDGDHWRQRRQMLQPAFGRPSVAAMATGVRSCIESRAYVWEEAVRSRQPLDVSDEANRLGLRIILRALFGRDLEDLDDRPGGNPFDLVIDVDDRDLVFAMRFRQLWPVVREIVEARRARGDESDDFLGRYMRAVDKETGEALDMNGLVDEVMTLLIAGHETSAATIAWAWSLLARHPGIQHELRVEAQRGLASAGEGEPPRFELAHRIVHETLRLYPPVWMFTRRALEDDVLAGYAVPKGSQILIVPFALHRHPKHWTDPLAFDPSRIPASGIAPVRGAYIPFSAGPRRCAGDHFALNVAVQHLTWASARYDLRPLPGEEDAWPRLRPGVNLRALDPIRLSVSAAH